MANGIAPQLPTPPAAAPSPNLGQVRGQLQELFGSIEGVYDKLKKQGKSQAAFQIRQAAQRYARSGAALGVNAFTRARALEDLKQQMTAAAQQAGAQAEAQKLAARMDAISKIATIDQAAFAQGMEQATFEEGKRSRMWQEAFSERELAQQKQLTYAGIGSQQYMQRQSLGQQEAEFARSLEQRQSEQAFAEAQALALAGEGTGRPGARTRFAAGIGGAMAPTAPRPGSLEAEYGRFRTIMGREPTSTEANALARGRTTEWVKNTGVDLDARRAAQIAYNEWSERRARPGLGSIHGRSRWDR